ncbi:MAG: invasion associated locus B family protein [Nitrosomonas sp.]|uniref:invasion associated locus B family protein n=1 Tax=Nitrosomonas sp. TaxID=42353 RepID=UPI0025DF4E12|nr:invasion associated locus B family protein [Nitrosomonas sp.]MBY0474792.1 invasion associated locus B family protein [Nitrosomonas sp.]
MKHKFTRLVTIGAIFILCNSVQAAEPKLIGQHGDWTAYTFMESDSKVCYMVSQPKKSEGNYTKRGDVFALITHRPAEKSKNVFSFIAGYSYKPGSDATVIVNNQSFRLFTQDDSAWGSDEATDNKITDAIKRGNSLVVKGASARGTATTDTFGLSGSSAAHKAISAECGVK